MGDHDAAKRVITMRRNGWSRSREIRNQETGRAAPEEGRLRPLFERAAREFGRSRPDEGAARPVDAINAYGCWGLVLRIVVLAELPRTRETLLLRLLGSGRLLREALADLAMLPDDAWEKSIATPLLVHFRLGSEEPATNKEDDVSAEIQAWFEDYQRKLRAEERTQGRNQGLAEGLAEGRAEEAARAVLTALRVRGIAVPDAARERILAQKEPETLERWLERAIVAASLAEVLDEPSRAA
jgi:hypothetical protein